MSLLLNVALFLRDTCSTLKLSSTQKFILFMISSRIGKNKDTWIKQYELAKECQITPRQLRTDLKALVDNNLIMVDKVITKKGKQDRYRVSEETLNYRKCTSPSVEETTGSDLPLVGGTTGSVLPHPTGSGLPVGPQENVVQLYEIIEEKEENKIVKDKLENNNKDKTKTNVGTAIHFEDFWVHFPRKENKKKAVMVWKRKKLDAKADLIIADVTNRKVNHKPWLEGFVPHATTYLNGERWEDAITEGTANATGNQHGNLTHRQATTKRAWDRLKAWN